MQLGTFDDRVIEQPLENSTAVSLETDEFTDESLEAFSIIAPPLFYFRSRARSVQPRKARSASS